MCRTSFSKLVNPTRSNPRKSPAAHHSLSKAQRTPPAAPATHVGEPRWTPPGASDGPWLGGRAPRCQRSLLRSLENHTHTHPEAMGMASSLQPKSKRNLMGLASNQKSPQKSPKKVHVLRIGIENGFGPLYDSLRTPTLILKPLESRSPRPSASDCDCSSRSRSATLVIKGPATADREGGDGAPVQLLRRRSWDTWASQNRFGRMDDGIHMFLVLLCCFTNSIVINPIAFLPTRTRLLLASARWRNSSVSSLDKRPRRLTLDERLTEFIHLHVGWRPLGTRSYARWPSL